MAVQNLNEPAAADEPPPPVVEAPSEPPDASAQQSSPVNTSVYFSADPTSVSSGGTTTVRWDVEGVSEVYFEGAPVTGHEQREITPTQDETFTLHVVFQDGSAQDYAVSVTVGETATGTGQPDLVVAGDLPAAVQGQPFTPRVTVSNQGSADAGAFTVRWHFHGATGLADCNWDMGGLRAGQQWSDSCERTTNSQPGTSPTRLTADVEGEISESDEGNNEITPTLTVGGAVACSGTPNISGFSASPQSIAPGAPSTLSWTVGNAEAVEIDQGVGEVGVTGSKAVSPATTTTYTITARCGNKTAISKALVTVTGPPACSGVPNIAMFAANPSAIASGDSSNLSWGVTNSDSVEIDHGVGTVNPSASKAVRPASTTTYTLTAHCGTRTATKQVTVQVKATFAVTNITANADPPFFTGSCPHSVTFSFTITTNGPGTVTYKYVECPNCPTDTRTLQFSAAGSRTVNTGALSYNQNGTHTAKLQVLTPNPATSDQAKFTITCAAPDLVVRNLHVPSQVVHGPHELTVSWVVVNQATGQAGPSKSRWSTAGGAEKMEWVCNVPALAPGASYRCGMTFLNVTLTAGKTYGTWAEADSENAVAEGDKENNNKSDSAPVKVQ